MPDRSEVMTQIKRDMFFQFGVMGGRLANLSSFDPKIGRNALKPVVGKWGLHETSNNNGIRATDFAANNNKAIIRMYILATQNIQTDTLQSPAIRTNNQIDRVFVDGRDEEGVY